MKRIERLLVLQAFAGVTFIVSQPVSAENLCEALFTFPAPAADSAPLTPSLTQQMQTQQAPQTLASSKPPTPWQPVTKITPRHWKSILFSSDVEFLRSEAIMDSSPHPQKNLGLVEPTEQFRLNQEAGAILQKKSQAAKQSRDRVIQVKKGYESEVRAAVIEQFEMMIKELPVAAPNAYRVDGDVLINTLNGHRVARRDLEAPASRTTRDAIEKLGLLVPDDLIFLKKIDSKNPDAEFVLIGGFLAAPTRWDLDRHLSHKITEIHQPELIGLPPEASAQLSKMINNVLQSTLSGRVSRRNNWYLQTDPRYPLPGYSLSQFPEPNSITAANYKNAVFLRLERQTFRGMQQSGVVVFAIQPMVFNLDTVMSDRTAVEKLLSGIRVKILPDEGPRSFQARILTYMSEETGIPVPQATIGRGGPPPGVQPGPPAVSHE